MKRPRSGSTATRAVLGTAGGVQENCEGRKFRQEKAFIAAPAGSAARDFIGEHAAAQRRGHIAQGGPLFDGAISAGTIEQRHISTKRMEGQAALFGGRSRRHARGYATQGIALQPPQKHADPLETVETARAHTG